MREKNTGVPINQDEIYHYLKDIRKIKVMTPDREKELAVKMKSEEIKTARPQATGLATQVATPTFAQNFGAPHALGLARPLGG